MTQYQRLFRLSIWQIMSRLGPIFLIALSISAFIYNYGGPIELYFRSDYGYKGAAALSLVLLMLYCVYLLLSLAFLLLLRGGSAVYIINDRVVRFGASFASIQISNISAVGMRRWQFAESQVCLIKRTGGQLVLGLLFNYDANTPMKLAARLGVPTADASK